MDSLFGCTRWDLHSSVNVRDAAWRCIWSIFSFWSGLLETECLLLTLIDALQKEKINSSSMSIPWDKLLSPTPAAIIYFILKLRVFNQISMSFILGLWYLAGWSCRVGHNPWKWMENQDVRARNIPYWNQWKGMTLNTEWTNWIHNEWTEAEAMMIMVLMTSTAPLIYMGLCWVIVLPPLFS